MPQQYGMGPGAQMGGGMGPMGPPGGGMGPMGPMMPMPMMPGPVPERSVWAALGPVAALAGLGSAAAGAYALWRQRQTAEQVAGSDPQITAAVAELRETLVTVQAEQKKAAEDLQSLARQQSNDVRELVSALRSQGESQQRQHTQTLNALTQLTAAVQAKSTVDISKASIGELASAVGRAAGEGAQEGAPRAEGPEKKLAGILTRIAAEAESKAEEKKVLTTLLLIFKNLLNDPDCERYRKVNTSSQRFQQRFGAQSTASEMLRAGGFVEEGGSFVFQESELDAPQAVKT